jgi:polyhydroxybutyrate depolymerase
MKARASNHGLNVASIALACTALTSSCMSEAPMEPGGSGGMSGGAGGSLSAGVGGASAAGGAAGTAMNVGGSAGAPTAGTTSTGGASATGGSPPSSAGTTAAGTAGQTNTGGTSGSSGAGAAGASGAGATNGNTGGSGGTSGTSGGAGAGGASGGTGGVATSTGCGATTFPESDTYTIDVSGMSREYILAVPDDYDPSRPYRLIFGWHWRGGSAENVAGGTLGGGPYYGLESRAEGSAIFVAPEGLDAGWANTGGRDIEFLRPCSTA